MRTAYRIIFQAGNILYDIDADSCTFEIATGDENTFFTVNHPKLRYKSMITNQHRCMEWTLCHYADIADAAVCTRYCFYISYICRIAGCTPSSSESLVTWWKNLLENRYSARVVKKLNRVNTCPFVKSYYINWQIKTTNDLNAIACSYTACYCSYYSGIVRAGFV